MAKFTIEVEMKVKFCPACTFIREDKKCFFQPDSDFKYWDDQMKNCPLIETREYRNSQIAKYMVERMPKYAIDAFEQVSGRRIKVQNKKTRRKFVLTK